MVLVVDAKTKVTYLSGGFIENPTECLQRQRPKKKFAFAQCT